MEGPQAVVKKSWGGVGDEQGAGARVGAGWKEDLVGFVMLPEKGERLPGWGQPGSWSRYRGLWHPLGREPEEGGNGGKVTTQTAESLTRLQSALERREAQIARRRSLPARGWGREGAQRAGAAQAGVGGRARETPRPRTFQRPTASSGRLLHDAYLTCIPAQRLVLPGVATPGASGGHMVAGGTHAHRVAFFLRQPWSRAGSELFPGA